MKTLLSAAAAAALAVIAAPASAVSIRTLHSFAGGNSANPYAGLIADASGTLYGTTAPNNGAAGTVFSLSKDGSNFTTLVNFNGSNGGSPRSRLVADASGTLYGTTAGGGNLAPPDSPTNPGGGLGGGTLFSLSTDGSNFTTLVNFGNGIDSNPSSSGAGPSGNLFLDASGTIYGTTSYGGQFGQGTVYSRTSNGTLTYLANFGDDYSDPNLVEGGGPQGPEGGVIADASGTLYGTTLFGGSPNGSGTVFSLSSGGTVTTLVADESIFSFSWSSLLLDASGTLYGTDYNSSGSSGFGSVFSLTSSGVFTTLVRFDGSNGSGPYAGLIADASGTLYGVTEGGGAGNAGTVFSLSKDGSNFTTLASFAADGSNGTRPTGDLYMDASGKLFGTTVGGGDNDMGTVWTLDSGVVPEPASWAMLIAGFGLTGAVMRRRRVTAAIA
jgi:uncharacterized repeat protein (TIGR03803 family)